MAFERGKKEFTTKITYAGGIIMNKKLPYEEALESQFDDLPIPDENQSWQRMKQLLDKDKKRSLPAFLRRYGVLCLLALWFVTVMCFVVKKMNKMDKVLALKSSAIGSSTQNIIVENKPETEEKPNTEEPYRNDKVSEESNHEESTPNIATKTDSQKSLSNEEVKSQDTNQSIVTPKEKSQSKQKTIAKTIQSGPSKTIDSKTVGTNKINPSGFAVRNKKPAKSTLPPSKKQDHFIENDTPINQLPLFANRETKEKNKPEPVQKEMAKLDEKEIAHTPTTNTETDRLLKEKVEVTKADETPLVKGDSNNANTTQKAPMAASAIKKPKVATGLAWSAGVGIQQQIPVGGQIIKGYNSNGKQSFLADYIPSVYVRVENPGKWFGQAEFSYGAPQPVNEFAFNRKSILSNNFSTITTTSMRLKKIYYHEIPLSFNYYIKAGWSVGVGGLYSILNRAVIEKETNTKNSLNQQVGLSTQVVPVNGYTDSFLYRSQWHWLLQTDYQWNRFSFGARFTQNLQPYIRFTLPNGEINDRKNWSLEFFIRFRLWQSSKFKQYTTR